MENEQIDFHNQVLEIRNSNWIVLLRYENYYSEEKALQSIPYDKIINVIDNEFKSSCLSIQVIAVDNADKCLSCLVSGLDGATWLCTSESSNDGQSVKLVDDNLFLSCGFTLLSINISEFKLNWSIRPDIGEIFEFYDLEGDFLLRGELAAHRINIKGEMLWSYGCRDILVNIEGQKEIEIMNNMIKLIDFESNEYFIDFLGKTISAEEKKNDQTHF